MSLNESERDELAARIAQYDDEIIAFAGPVRNPEDAEVKLANWDRFIAWRQAQALEDLAEAGWVLAAKDEDDESWKDEDPA
jgi:hypothetical protein